MALQTLTPSAKAAELPMGGDSVPSYYVRSLGDSNPIVGQYNAPDGSLIIETALHYPVQHNDGWIPSPIEVLSPRSPRRNSGGKIIEDVFFTMDLQTMTTGVKDPEFSASADSASDYYLRRPEDSSTIDRRHHAREKSLQLARHRAMQWSVAEECLLQCDLQTTHLQGNRSQMPAESITRLLQPMLCSASTTNTSSPGSQDSLKRQSSKTIRTVHALRPTTSWQTSFGGCHWAISPTSVRLSIVTFIDVT